MYNKKNKENNILNINKIIKEKGISIAAISRKSGISYSTVRDKLTGRSEFKINETIKIYNTFFKEYDYVWLFSENDSQ